MDSQIFGPTPEMGKLWSGVIEAELSEDHTTQVWILPHRQVAWIRDMKLGRGRLTVYGMKVLSVSPRLILSPSEEATWFSTNPSKERLTPYLLELCAGFGGMGIGASFLGGIPFLSVDHCRLCVEHLEANQHGEVLQMDLNAPETVRAIHEKIGCLEVMTTFGFPCQPYSSQGLQRGFFDYRAQTLLSGLHLLWMLPVQYAVLECVPRAGTTPEVQHAIGLLLAARGWTMLDLTFDLGTQWGSNRSRWWALLIPSSWLSCGISSWPIDTSYLTIGSIIGGWGSWDEAAENDLQLSLEELDMYNSPLYGMDKRMMTLNDQGATILHSYSNATSACPCSCRSSGFSERSLEEKGLRGYFAPSQTHGNPRFLHPRELGAILGVPDSVCYVHSPRASNCLLGLIASPLQMVWMLSSLKQNFDITMGLPSTSPIVHLEAYKQELLRQLRLSFPATSTPPGYITLASPEGELLHVVSFSSFTVGQLLSAQRISLPWGCRPQISMTNGTRLSDDEFLQGPGPYLLEFVQKRSAREPPTGDLAIGISHRGIADFAFLRPGQFLFEALRQLDIDHICFLRDETGRVFGADFRAWRSLQLETLETQFFTSLPTIRADGLDNLEQGLTEHTIWRGLQCIANHCTSMLLLHPRECLLALQGKMSQFRLDFHDDLDSVIGIFPARNHWALVFGKIQDQQLHWTYLDGLPGFLSLPARFLCEQLTLALGLGFGSFRADSLLSQSSPTSCGTIALAHACHCVGLDGEFSSNSVEALHAFFASWSTQAFGLRANGPASIATITNELADLLHSKGVPSELSRERAGHTIDKLGPSTVRAALQSKHPWSTLKAEANRPQTMMRLVYPLELSQHNKDQATSRHGASIAKDKKRKKPTAERSTIPLRVDPSSLELLPGTFVDDEGKAVEPINLNAVVAESRGIALCSIDDAEHYIKTGITISSNALALAIAELPDAEIAKEAGITSAHIPAKHPGTGEPLLLVGGLYQLGDKKVSRKSSIALDTSDIVSTGVLKLQVFRDSCDHWNSFIKAPIKDTIARIPALQLCRDPQCSKGPLSTCLQTHPAVDEEFEQVVMDVWARSFISMEGKRVDAERAEIFTVFLRVPSTAVLQILQQQPIGYFFEPRLEGSQGSDPSFRIVWLPGLDHQAAMHKAKTCLKVICMMRLKNRFGVRVLQKDEASVFSSLRPDTPYTDIAVTQTYQLYPLPHGTTKTTLTSLLAKWNWTARALHPGKGSKEAMAWVVGSSSPPPQLVLPGYKMEVLVTELKHQPKSTQAPLVVASRRTEDFIRKGWKNSNQEHDPWTDSNNDPWRAYKSSSGATSSKAAVEVSGGQKHYDQMARDLRRSLHEELKNDLGTMQTASIDPGLEQRMTTLESGMQEIQTQNSNFQSWFNDMGTKYQVMQSAVTDIQTNAHKQAQDIQQIGTDLRGTQAHLQTALLASIGEVKSELGAELTKRFDTFESLLSKRNRMED